MRIFPGHNAYGAPLAGLTGSTAKEGDGAGMDGGDGMGRRGE